MNNLVKIHNDRDAETSIETEEAEYLVKKDGQTGDWLLSSPEDDGIQSFWFSDRDSAVQFALRHVGVIETAQFSWAPDRT